MKNMNVVQGISVSLVKERGERLMWGDIDFAPVINEMASQFNNSAEEAIKVFPFIGSIDPSGAT